MLQGKIDLPKTVMGYAIPYCTFNGNDTEYLISNPNAGTISGTLHVFGQKCLPVKKIPIKLGPNCTRSLRLASIVHNHAGHCVLQVNATAVINILYYRLKDMVLVGSEQAGRDSLFAWHPLERSRSYGFGYRSNALGHDLQKGLVFVSNPYRTVLYGTIEFYDQQCGLALSKRVRVKPGCTAAYPFPVERFGYGRITVSHQAVINVLYISSSSQGIAAAELIGEADRISTPAKPEKRSRILFDDTHRCRPGVTGDWTAYEAALVNAGCTVSHHTAPSVTLTELKKHDVFVIVIARTPYTDAERKAIMEYVNGGGSLMIVQDFGNAPWSVPTRMVMNKRNFMPHPIVQGFKSFHVDACSSLSGDNEWSTVVETDDDSSPSRRPVVMARTFGAGRIVIFGDSNTWCDHYINNLENKLFGLRCAEWLLFRI
jgi:hypothetical protein